MSAILSPSPKERSRKVLLLNWIIAFGCLPALILSHSRSAFVALGLCAALCSWRRWHWRALLVAPVLLGAVFIGSPQKWIQSGSMHDRNLLWRDTIDGLTTFGSGIGSFYSTFPKYASRLDTQQIQPWHAHNDILELGFELGVPGIILVLVLGGLVFWRAGEPEKSVLVALGVIAMFGFPLHTPATAFLFGAVAGHAARAWHPLRSRLIHSRSILHGWGERTENEPTGSGDIAVSVQSRIPAWSGASSHSR